MSHVCIGSAGNGNDTRGDHIADDTSTVLLLTVMILQQAWDQMTEKRRMFLFQGTIRSPIVRACGVLFRVVPCYCIPRAPSSS